jgi:YesN/AraC family two-component response regulator
MEISQKKNSAKAAPKSRKRGAARKGKSITIGVPKAEMVPSSGRMKEIYENVVYCIEDKQIYLDTRLNLGKFARLLFTNTTYLSKVINSFWGCNLKTLLNRYRVEYAKVLLTQEKCDFHTLPARSGFASKSTFYTAFMKYAGIKPADYRYMHLKEEIRRRIDIEIANALADQPV